MSIARIAALGALSLVVGMPGPAAATTAKASPADLDDFVRALPARGSHDVVFMAPPAALMARLGVDAATLRKADPGIACDPAGKTPVLVQSTLGRVGQLQTVCLPNGTSQGLLTLDAGDTFITTCGHAGWQATVSIDATVGDTHLHASTDPAPARAPTHACNGWTKVPR